MEGRINIIKMAIIPRVIYRLHAISIKIPVTQKKQSIPKFIGNQRIFHIGKAILNKNKETFLDLKLYYKPVVAKTACF
jgi:hypothetical protein